MCRAGDRKCYHGWSQEQKATDLARRRAIYAANKTGTVRTYKTGPQPVYSKSGVLLPPETTHAGNLVNKKNPVSTNVSKGDYQHSVNPFFTTGSIEFKGETVSKDKLFTEGSEVVKENAALGISFTENSGQLADHDYFAKNTVRGQLQYWNLSEQSRESLGFKEIDSEQGIGTWSSDGDFGISEFSQLSAVEIEDIEQAQKMSLRFFTSNNYKWINDALYGVKELDEPTSNNVLPEEYFAGLETEHYFDTYDDNIPHTKDTLDKVTKLMDQALQQHAPHKQRIVYRGMSVWNNAFSKHSGLDGIPARDKWLDDHITIGQEIQFDGYQSSSLNYASARDYAQDGGVLYEILTPEGINVTSISQYEEEQEVLLPRNARYMVVSRRNNVNAPKYGYEQTMTVISLVAVNSKGEILDGTNADYQLPTTEDS